MTTTEEFSNHIKYKHDTGLVYMRKRNRERVAFEKFHAKHKMVSRRFVEE